MKRAVTAALALGLAAALVGCGSDAPSSEPTSSSTVSAAEAPRYDGAGPHAVGRSTLDVDGNPVVVWYPAAGSAGDVVPDAAVAPDAEAVPLVVFAHGLALSALDYEPQLAHVASWGIVVAAPERTKDVDLLRVADDLTKEVARVSSPLAGLIEPDAPIVVGGHSQGTGNATLVAADHPGRVLGAFVEAGGGAPAALQDMRRPLLALAGGRDTTTETWVRPNLADAAGPYELVVVEDAGHNSFTRLCSAGADAVLGPSDCAPTEAEDAALQRVIDHAVVAFVRWRAALDASPAALEPAVLADLGAAVTVKGSFGRG